MRIRDTNLDLLRATAILMVLVYHICQRWPVALPRVTAVTQYGAYGVDLFFVLSGWLIGNLLWREHTQFGDVEIGRFVGRRALRTVPPYLAALIISYTGVFLARHEPFDWGYVLFLQNYYERIPYFLISWSLCIEEQFYFFMPVLVLSLTRAPSHWPHVFLLSLVAIPALCRFFTSHSLEVPPFGYHYTATHLRYEGLLLGVWASFLCVKCPELWLRLRRIAPIALLPVLFIVVVTAGLSEAWRYSLFYSTISVFFLCLLVTVVERRPLCFSDTRVVFWIASTSYSVYLTHAFTLDASLRLVAKLPAISILQALTIVSCITISGVVFYRIIEIPSLAIRRRWIPDRSSERGAGLNPGQPVAGPRQPATGSH